MRERLQDDVAFRAPDDALGQAVEHGEEDAGDDPTRGRNEPHPRRRRQQPAETKHGAVAERTAARPGFATGQVKPRDTDESKWPPTPRRHRGGDAHAREKRLCSAAGDAQCHVVPVEERPTNLAKIT